MTTFRHAADHIGADLSYRSFFRHTAMSLSLLAATSLGCGSKDDDPSASSQTGDDDDDDSGTGDDDDDIGDAETEGLGPFSEISASIHSKVKTLIVVEWTQDAATDSVFVEYTFEDDVWLESPGKPGTQGAHSEVLLGIPEGSDVQFRLVANDDGKKVVSEYQDTANGTVPSAMPSPRVEFYDEDLASDHRYMLGAVSEKGEHGYGGPHWIYILDREGRVNWYYRPAGGSSGQLNQSFWPRLSRDGTHITIDRQIRNEYGSLLFTTLDFEYEAEIDLPAHQDCYDVTTDGKVLYNRADDETLYEVSPNGNARALWRCTLPYCYANAVNYDPASDTVLMSFPYPNTVARIDRSSGDLLALWGDHGDWDFEPSNYGLDFNHWSNISPEGTFMVSSHLPNTGTHLFMEYEIDEATKTLRRVWSYGHNTDDWADERGMVARVPGGNAIGNYGPTGVIVEITPDEELAWRIEFPGRLLGNNILIDDLYALNRGPTR